jgi:alkyl sulfatase BDS1-like metallo-beta-lactamase superfamily hydrolase
MAEMTGAGSPKDASPSVIAQQQAVRNALPFADTADFDDAARGFLGTIEHAKVTSERAGLSGAWNPTASSAKPRRRRP